MEKQNRRDPRTYEIISAAMEVHGILGQGFLENVYHEALSLEFKMRNLPFRHEVDLPLYYKETRLSTTYRADFVCFNNVLVEIKALGQLTGKEESQIIHYINASGLETGLLLNFGSKRLEFKRFIVSGKSVAVHENDHINIHGSAESA